MKVIHLLLFSVPGLSRSEDSLKSVRDSGHQQLPFRQLGPLNSDDRGGGGPGRHRGPSGHTQCVHLKIIISQTYHKVASRRVSRLGTHHVTNRIQKVLFLKKCSMLVIETYVLFIPFFVFGFCEVLKI